MNAPEKMARVDRRGRDIVVTVAKSFVLEGGWGVYRVEGRQIVLHPNDATHAIPPGSYTPETLPPLSEGAKAILASIDAVAPLVDIRTNGKAAAQRPSIEIENAGVGIELEDEGLPGIDPGE